MYKNNKEKKKATVKSQSSLQSTKTGMRETYSPLDGLFVCIHSLRLSDDDKRNYHIKVTFFDNVILSGLIKPISPKDQEKKVVTIAKGVMSYDPSDYEKMCLFASAPLVVTIAPQRAIESRSHLSHSADTAMSSQILSTNSLWHKSSTITSTDICCCFVDILPLFIDTDKICVKKRMQPIRMPPLLLRKSWDNLPLLKMGISIERHPENANHHSILQQANHMKITLIGAYNLLTPYDKDTQYTAATNFPLFNETHTTVMEFNHGYNPPEEFDEMKFYPSWETLRAGHNTICKSDDKLEYSLREIQNERHIDIAHYLELQRLSQMDKIICAVPLQLHDSTVMIANTNYPYLINPAERSGDHKKKKLGPQSPFPASDTSSVFNDSSVMNEKDPPFVLIEVTLGRPLVPECMPPLISSLELSAMLHSMEEANPQKRECVGRGQLERDWQTTVRLAANVLKRVPHHGLPDFCLFNRQLSETRTRVEATTSFWLEGAIYVNNNFLVEDYLKNNDKYEELLLMAHMVLTNSAIEAIVPTDVWYETDPSLRAARHARHLQDVPHAIELYLQESIEKPSDGNVWRELSTALKDVDRDWASVCINKSLKRDYRHPLTLLSKGCMVFETNPDAAEPFFRCLISLYPFWLNGWVITSIYYMQREFFKLADEVMKCSLLTQSEGLQRDIGYGRAWELELGDWWEPTPLLPGMSVYYDAADLLLRLRAMPLAEACLARSLCDSGETAAYYHLVALCFRLHGQIDEALCHLRTGINKFGEVSYLRSLEAECLHVKGDQMESLAAFQKAGNNMCPYSVLLSLSAWEPARVRVILVDLLRRHPNAYAWMALANDWLLRAQLQDDLDLGLKDEQDGVLLCATACAVQALKWDRRAGRAWALLAQLVHPQVRRDHCVQMAINCGYPWTENDVGSWWKTTRDAVCYRLGIPLVHCDCAMCQTLVA
ncbi:uncharacterized protein LOC113239976 isoform X2 [Hyposmocoma kahamanoa]|uniref:uncharacterized protein LOC113239976 isoform X2 n=1 Tax=Hyposmocoma kahamanoa TaxID=1477025 RepID=UPI000E6D7E44|nr:uncharacterized protein LOC113239976 isoform X2 [Hyposmocoma kahamanoa]